MSKKFLKIQQSPTPGFFFVFSADNWAEIESKEVYGYELSPKVRELLSLATLFLTMRLPEERTAPRMDSANKRTKSVLTRIEELKSRAETLRSELFSPHHWAENYQPDTHPMSLETRLQLELALLTEAADLHKQNSEVGEFALLRFSLGAVIASCDKVMSTIRKGSCLFREGQTWDVWIVLLTSIMKSYKLDCGTLSGEPS